MTNSDVNLTIIEEKSDTSLQDGFESVNVTSGVCSVCRKQKYDKFISCSDCCNKAHISCLDKNVGILRMKPDNTWQCPFCKTCVFCEETADSVCIYIILII